MLETPMQYSVFRLRLPTAEFHALLASWRKSGGTISDYIRRALNAYAARPTLQATTSTWNASAPYEWRIGEPASTTECRCQIDDLTITYS
jgi:hypothetical protein